MSATTTPTTTHRLTVTDSREEKLNGAPALSVHYDFPDAASAELLGQLLLQQEIQAPGRWRHSIAGGIREVTIDEIIDTEP
jgi:hypothetical protein